MNRPLPPPQAVQKQFEQYNNAMEQALKFIFKAEIRSSFLLEIRRNVLAAILPEIRQLYDLNITPEKLVAGQTISIDYEISRVIIGAHHANTIFLTREERTEKQRTQDYKKRITWQAVEMIAWRRYAADFFRKKPINQAGEKYNYYPVPYLLFALCMRIDEIFIEKGIVDDAAYMESHIMNKAVAALTLLEDQFLDSAYLPCRTVIELFIKLILFRKHPHLFTESKKYEKFDVDKTRNSQKYTNDFYTAFNNRKAKAGKEAEFLHYGFVDTIPWYHDIVANKAYSIDGIIQYLSADADDEILKTIKQLKRLHTTCHGYAHGNVSATYNPTLHYFEISIILGEIIPRTYAMICKDYDVPADFENYSILERFNSEFSLLKEQYNKRSVELFELERKKANT